MTFDDLRRAFGAFYAEFFTLEGILRFHALGPNVAIPTFIEDEFPALYAWLRDTPGVFFGLGEALAPIFGAAIPFTWEPSWDEVIRAIANADEIPTGVGAELVIAMRAAHLALRDHLDSLGEEGRTALLITIVSLGMRHAGAFDDEDLQ